MRLGLWAYVLYRAFNFLRNSTRHFDRSDVEGLFTQYLVEAVSGHEGATRFVQNCWRQEYRHSFQEAGHSQDEEQDHDSDSDG